MNKIVINWGSSGFRAYLVNTHREITDVKYSDLGMLKISMKTAAELLLKTVTEWNDVEQVILFGMVGAKNGLYPIDYTACPVDIKKLTRDIVCQKTSGIEYLIIPGVIHQDNIHVADVMRGEEVEIMGLICSQERFMVGRHFLVLPGTHSKWVEINDGHISTFFTSISGELFDCLAEAGSLKQLIKPGKDNERSFIDGVQQAFRNPGGLSRLIFSTRARIITEKLDIQYAASYTRGLLIGSEIIDAIEQFNYLKKYGKITIVGNQNVAKWYAKALKFLMIDSEQVDTKIVSVIGALALSESFSTKS